MAATTRITVICHGPGVVELYSVHNHKMLPRKRFHPACVYDPESKKHLWIIEIDIEEVEQQTYHFIQGEEVIMEFVGSSNPRATRNNRKKMRASFVHHAVADVVVGAPALAHRHAAAAPRHAPAPHHIAPPSARGAHRRDPDPPGYDDGGASWDDAARAAPRRRGRRA